MVSLPSIVKSNNIPFLTICPLLGRIIVPGTTYLQLVWETLAMMVKGAISPVVNVEFEDVRFLRATTMLPGQKIDFTVMVKYLASLFALKMIENKQKQ